MLRCFVKRELLHDISALQLVKLDVKKNWVQPTEVKIGLGAESVLKVQYIIFLLAGWRQHMVSGHSLFMSHYPSVRNSSKKKEIGELAVLEFRRECTTGMSKIIQKVQEKSPLKYAIVRQIACLDPKTMYTDPDWCQARMSSLVQRFLQNQQLSGGVSAGRRE